MSKELNRLSANKTILLILQQYIEANPTVRFNQALSNLNIVVRDTHTMYDVAGNVIYPEHSIKDDYYTEPEYILKRMK